MGESGLGNCACINNGFLDNIGIGDSGGAVGLVIEKRVCIDCGNEYINGEDVICMWSGFVVICGGVVGSVGLGDFVGVGVRVPDGIDADSAQLSVGVGVQGGSVVVFAVVPWCCS